MAKSKKVHSSILLGSDLKNQAVKKYKKLKKDGILVNYRVKKWKTKVNGYPVYEIKTVW